MGQVPGDGHEKINAVYANAKSLSKAKNLSGQEKDGVDAVTKPWNQSLVYQSTIMR